MEDCVYKIDLRRSIQIFCLNPGGKGAFAELRGTADTNQGLLLGNHLLVHLKLTKLHASVVSQQNWVNIHIYFLKGLLFGFSARCASDTGGDAEEAGGALPRLLPEF